MKQLLLWPIHKFSNEEEYGKINTTVTSVSQYTSFFKNNFISLYLLLLSFNATLIIDLSIIPYIIIVEREII